jgi:hypothetical protein
MFCISSAYSQSDSIMRMQQDSVNKAAQSDSVRLTFSVAEYNTLYEKWEKINEAPTDVLKILFFIDSRKQMVKTLANKEQPKK